MKNIHSSIFIIVDILYICLLITGVFFNSLHSVVREFSQWVIWVLAIDRLLAMHTWQWVIWVLAWPVVSDFIKRSFLTSLLCEFLL